MELHKLQSLPKARKHRAKIVGRGHGSGLGKTSGRGQKGQKARKSGRTRPGFEGGQTPLYRRLPKFGFSTVAFKTKPVFLNLKMLLNHTERSYSRSDFVRLNWIANKLKAPVKLIGNTNLPGPVDIQVQAVSAAAKQAVEKAGGKVIIVDLSQALKDHKKVIQMSKEQTKPNVI